jgi:hypothetical protein
MIEIHAELKRLLRQMHDTAYQKQEKILHFLQEEERLFPLVSSLTVPPVLSSAS